MTNISINVLKKYKDILLKGSIEISDMYAKDECSSFLYYDYGDVIDDIIRKIEDRTKELHNG